jgi:tetratricopeptide (TPR) repeat protein
MSLAVLTWRQGDLVQAEALVREGLALHQEIGAKPNTVWGLDDLGLLLLDRGAYEQAGAAFAEAWRCVEAWGLVPWRSEVLLGAAALAAALGEPERALRLAGAAAQAHGRQRYDPYQQGTINQWLQHARERLGADTQAAAWATGQAMTPEAVRAAVGPAARPTPTDTDHP